VVPSPGAVGHSGVERVLIVGKAIFILSGMPAAGKTYILNKPAARRAEFFGRYSSQAAQTFDRTGDKGYHHYPYLKTTTLWQNVVVHVDVTSACSFKTLPYRLFQNEEFILEQFRNNFSSILRNYDRVVINTLRVDLTLLTQRYFARDQGLELFDRTNVFRLYRNRDEATFTNISNAWNKFVTEVSSYSLRTTGQDPNYHIAEL
jgi:hypothetical protein